MDSFRSAVEGLRIHVCTPHISADKVAAADVVTVSVQRAAETAVDEYARKYGVSVNWCDRCRPDGGDMEEVWDNGVVEMFKPRCIGSVDGQHIHLKIFIYVFSMDGVVEAWLDHVSLALPP